MLSPHLDDAAFSVGTLAANLAATGQRVVVATAFTATVEQPVGFALRCQTDKGFAPEVDYMALRRAEDQVACKLLGLEVEHWGFAEAPHRGYDSPSELFASLRESEAEEGVLVQLAKRISLAITTHLPSHILYPVGAGNHVDHLLLIAAVDSLRASHPNINWLQWYDQPYVSRSPTKFAELAFAKTVRSLADVTQAPCSIKLSSLDEPSLVQAKPKWQACLAYASQLTYQFYTAQQLELPPAGPSAAHIAEVVGPHEWLQLAQPMLP